MVHADVASAHAVIQKYIGVLEWVRTVGKMTAAKRGGEHQKYTSHKKKIPLSPQVHTSEVPVHLRKAHG